MHARRAAGILPLARTSFLAALAILVALASCASWGRPHASDELADGDGSAAASPLRVFFTGDTEGFLTPCGCETSQYGGLPRRAAYLRRIARPGDLRIDLGNLVTGDSPEHLVILDYSLEGLRTLAYDALVPGAGEVLLGKTFEDAAAQRGLAVVCANLVRAADGSAVFPPWLVRRLADGRTAAVVGVTEPFEGVPAGYRILAPADAVRDAVAALRGKADVVIVAGALRETTTLALAAQADGAALVAGGWATEGSSGLVKTAGAPALLVGEFGWYVSRVDFDPALRIADARQVWLDEEVPDDPDVAGLVARYKAELSKDGGEFGVKLLASFVEQGYAGSQSCAECHAEEFEVWRNSKHAHAMQTLVAKKEETNRLCVACHLVDVPPAGVAQGTASPRIAETLGLGCEGCHGAAARHADLAQRGNLAEAARALAPATTSACLRCHFPPNDTHFDAVVKWPKIAHGKKRR